MANEFFKSLTINVNPEGTDMNIGGDRFNDGFEGVITHEDNGDVTLSVNPTSDALNVIYRDADLKDDAHAVVEKLGEVVREYNGFVSPYKVAVADFNEEHKTAVVKPETASETETPKTEAATASAEPKTETATAHAEDAAEQPKAAEATATEPASTEKTEAKDEPAEHAASPFQSKPFGTF